MFFKRIEMIGFKSFATKTVCDLIPGTTIIVGPNGCGKSNILDAVKWVFGEQAAKQMRGKKMQDVIFAGSASFKAMGVAQVTVTIDNSRRILPIDYDEVQITRRLFRTGESEYLLNKVACRLRDISDLIMGTGIGRSAYSILEQGRVDQIVNARPEDRRFLIEEAAGISKYRVRKLQALRKLERTEVDLSRLNDLLSEVERQVASLKRQASKARRFQELSEQCRQSEQQLFVVRTRDLRGRLKQIAAQMDELSDQLTGYRTELAGAEAGIEAARNREGELNFASTGNQQNLFDLKNNLSQCQNDVRRHNDRIGAIATRIEQIQAELSGELDQEAQDIELRIEEEELRIEQGREALAEHEAAHAELRARYSELQTHSAERTRRIEQLNMAVTRLRDEIGRADNEVNTAEALIRGQQETRAETEAQIAELSEALAGHEQRHAALSSQAEKLAAEIERLDGEVKAIAEQQAARQRELADMMRAIDQTNHKIHAGEGRLETLRDLKANYDGYYQGVREVMLAAERRELNGVIGVAANLLHTEQAHELAIEVALATHLQDIVTHTAEQARAAIDYLKQWGRGRATFLPLDRLQANGLPPSLRSVLGRSGVVGLASELVRFDPAIRTAVEHMLGSTIVVEDLRVGLDLGGAGLRGRYVSLDGQLINPSGAMTGGRVKTTGLMTREREIRELETSLAELSAAHGRLTADVDRTQTTLNDLHERARSAQEELETRRREQAGLLRDVDAAGRTRDTCAADLANRQRQIEKIDAEVEDKRRQIARAGETREARSADLAEAEQELNRENEAARGEGANFAEMGGKVAEAGAQAERARDRIANAEAALHQCKQDLETVARRRANRFNEIEELRREDAQTKEQVARLEQEANGVRREVEVVSTRLAAQQTELEDVRARIKELAGRIETLTRDNQQLEGKVHELELRDTELKTNLGNISEQCEEKFGEGLDALMERIGEPERDGRSLHVEVCDLRGKIERMGSVNLQALDEYEEQARRFEYLQGQHADLSAARRQLLDTIAELDATTRELFQQTFESVRGHFVERFRRLFNGGKADLVLDAPEGVDPLLEGGIEIVAQPPGKKLQNLTLMSGGEKALTAVALLFALFLHKPSPFCVLDEIDAPLDDVNVERLGRMLREFSRETQFVIITHNKLTMQLADAIYGVTMEESGVSKLVSVRFEQAEEMVDAG